MGAFSDLLTELRELVGPNVLVEFRYWSDVPMGDSPSFWEVRYQVGYAGLEMRSPRATYHGRTGEEALRSLVEQVKKDHKS